jgi:signal transduction histidine kinase
LKPLRRVKWLPLLVGAISLAITLLLWQALLLQREVSINRFTMLAAKSVKSEVANRLLFQVDSLSRMAKRWESRKGTPKREWMADAEAHIIGYAGYKAIEWVDPSLHIRWVVPEQGNQDIENIPAGFETKRMHAIEKSQQSKNPVIGQVVNLLEGGQGLLIFVPMYVEKQFNGFILGVSDVNEFLDNVISEHTLPGYNIRIAEGNDIIYQRGDDEQLEKQWGHEEILALYGTQWHIRVWPEHALLAESKSVLPNLILIVGLVITALLMFTTQFSQMTNHQAKEIAKVNENLQKEINERELAEQAKDKMKKALLQSQKMQAIGTLAGGIAHDFNNILYSMIGYVEMARDDVDPDSLVYDNLSKVISVGHRGQELVSRLLSFSRQQQHDFKPISLREVINSTLILLKPTLPASIAIEQIYTVKDEDVVLGGHTELQQVLVNIVSNAVDAIDDQGKITIKLYRIETDEAFRDRFVKLRKPSYFVFEITDTGRGMPQHVLTRIFEPFFTTKEVGKGTGLGLATALGIVHDHNGEMTVESSEGQGTKIFIYLPEYKVKEEEE